MSIRSRLGLAYGFGVVITLLLVAVGVWWQMGNALHGSLETALRTRAAGVLVSFENQGQAGIQEADDTPGVFAALFRPNGSLIDASSDAPRNLRPIDGIQDVGGRRYLVRVQVAPDGTSIVTGADLQPIAGAEADLARVLLGVGVGVGGISLIGGWLLAGRALRPLKELIEDADSLGPEDLQRRLVSPARLDEIGQLTLRLNAMLDRIADSVERQRLFVAMASHELRTPLASLRAELELAQRDGGDVADYRAAVRAAQGDVVRLAALSTSLLELAATPVDGMAIARAPVHLGQLFAGVVEAHDPLARQHGVSVRCDVPDATIAMDRTRIEHALGNLLSNAILHGGRGTVEIRARVAGHPGAEALFVEVLDRGPGLGDDQPADLFSPFRRGTGARGPGSGLGLATVAGAVRAHGGSFGAESRAGGGARFWFHVPAAPRRPDRLEAVALVPESAS